MRKFKILIIPVLLLLNTQLLLSQSWYQIPSPTTNNLNGLLDIGNTIYTYGNSGSLFVKDLNAITWTNLSAPSGINIKGMAAGTYIVGNAGQVYKSTNYGNSWSPFLSSYIPSSNPTFNINCADGLFIAGDGGNLAIAVNVGTGVFYWQHPPTGTTRRLNSIYNGFADAGTGYLIAVGDNGTILKSIYPYTSISSKPSGTTANLYCIAKGGDVTGLQFPIAVGANGTILKSTDAGETWTQSVSHTTNDLYCVSYLYGGYGYACGANGTILRDSSSFAAPYPRGINWIQQTSHTTSSLNAIEQFYGDEAYAVGVNGIILRTTTGGLPSLLSLTVLMQGFYNNTTSLMVPDSARVYLANTTSPYAIIDSAKAKLSNAGAGTFSFSNAASGTPYYIIVKHRNSIETWSSAGNSFSSGALTYNFTTSSSRAFGNNMVLKGTKYCIYSGDVNQDGTVDLSDLSLIDNDAYNFVSGYVKTDLTGDNFVDLSDYALADNNAFNFVSAVLP